MRSPTFRAVPTVGAVVPLPGCAAVEVELPAGVVRVRVVGTSLRLSSPGILILVPHGSPGELIFELAAPLLQLPVRQRARRKR